MMYDTIPIPGGFIKLKRSEATRELLKDPKAFGLLTAIALRAKRTDDFSIHGLEPGQALIGDHASYGLTEQEYRSAKSRLQRYDLVDFEPTHRGTIASLRNTMIYDINVTAKQQANNGPATDRQQTGNGRATTIKNEKNEKERRTITATPIARELAELLLDLIRQCKADFRTPNLDRWTRDIDRMIRLDERNPERIEAVIRWCRRDPFWQSNILSAAKLRKHFDTLELKMQTARPVHESSAEMFARMEQEGKI